MHARVEREEAGFCVWVIGDVFLSLSVDMSPITSYKSNVQIPDEQQPDEPDTTTPSCWHI